MTHTISYVKKKELHFHALLLGILVASVFFIPYIVYGEGYFLFYGDFNVQQVPFYQLCHNAIRSGEIGWNWYTDLGSNFIGSYSFYLLGSPFFWLTLPFPNSFLPHLMGPLLILKFGCAAFCAYFYIRRFTKNPESALLGSILYAFCGFSVYNIFFNHFHEAIIIFPLLLWAMEKHIADKKRGIFAIMVFFAAVTNYFFFFGMVVFCLIYWFIRTIGKCWKQKFISFLSLVFEAVLGLMLAMFILMPTILAVLQNDRLSSINIGYDSWLYGRPQIYLNILEIFFFPPDIPARPVFFPGAEIKWSSMGAWLPLFSTVGVFAFMKSKKKHWIKRLLLVCLFMALVPVLNSSFYMFNSAYYARWYFMPILIMCLGSVMAIEDGRVEWKSSYSLTFLITSLTTLIVGFWPSQRNEEGQITRLGMFSFADETSRDTSIFEVILAVVLMAATVSLIFYVASRLIFKKLEFKKVPSVISSVVLALAFAVVPILLFSENEFFSVKNNIVYFTRFWATCLVSIVSLFILGLILKSLRKYHKAFAKTALSAVCIISVIYSLLFIGFGSAHSYDIHNEVIPNYIEGELELEGDPDTFRIDCYECMDNTAMYLGYQGINAFHSIVPGSITEFYEYIGEERSVASRPTTESDGIRPLLSVKYLLARDGGTSFEDEDGEKLMQGYKYLKTENGLMVYENENFIPFGFTYDNYISYTDCNGYPEELRDEIMLKAMLLEDSQIKKYKNILSDVSEEGCFFNDESFTDDCKERAKTVCHTFKKTKEGFKAEIKLKRQNLVFFSVPFEKGWTAMVNGKEAEIEKVNVGFMAVLCEKGENTIEFKYKTPGLAIGIVISLASLVVFAGYMLLQRTIQKRKPYAYSGEWPEGEELMKYHSENPELEFEPAVIPIEISEETVQEEEDLSETVIDTEKLEKFIGETNDENS